MGAINAENVDDEHEEAVRLLLLIILFLQACSLAQLAKYELGTAFASELLLIHDYLPKASPTPEVKP